MSTAENCDFSCVGLGHFGSVEVWVQLAGYALSAASGQFRESRKICEVSAPSVRFRRDSRSRSRPDCLCSVSTKPTAASPIVNIRVVKMSAVTTA